MCVCTAEVRAALTEIRLLIGARHHCFVRGVLNGEVGFREAFRDLNRLYVELRTKEERLGAKPVLGIVLYPCKRIGARPSGRPKKHSTNAEKCRHYRERLKNGLVTRNTRLELIENAQLTDAKNRQSTNTLNEAQLAELERKRGC